MPSTTEECLPKLTKRKIRWQNSLRSFFSADADADMSSWKEKNASLQTPVIKVVHVVNISQDLDVQYIMCNSIFIPRFGLEYKISKETICGFQGSWKFSRQELFPVNPWNGLLVWRGRGLTQKPLLTKFQVRQIFHREILNLPLIMLTSLAPSPMDRVTALLYRFTRSTTCAFCSGVTRQQITAVHDDARSRKDFSTSSSSA